MKKSKKLMSFVLSAILLIGTVNCNCISAKATETPINESFGTLYSEDFDEYGTAVSLQAGNNTDYGLYFAKKSSAATATIGDGKLYLTGNGYDIVYIDHGAMWANYTVEADPS